ncbi:LD-carboxypeptidase, partial [Stomatobaculum longum]
MRYPHFLPENGSIGFISPSFGAATEPYRSAFLNARAKFEAMGYRCVTGPNAFVQEGVGISNTPEACAAEVNDFFTRKDTDILISLGGGELMCTILDAVDFPAIAAASPKWFMGFSDNTNLTFLLPTLCDTAAVYGPNAPAFGMEPWHPAL